MGLIKSKTKYDFTVKHKAFDYQHEAFLAIKDLPYAAIFHEQGLGKTKIAIDLLIYWLAKKDIDVVLIVTKKQLVKNWCGEFEEHTYIKPRTLDNNKSNNFFIFNSTANVVITNFEIVSCEKERMKLFLKTRNVAIVIDESTKIKNPESKLTQNFFELSSLFKIRLIMTGTPIANRPYDIWAQIFFLDQGKSLGTNFKEFQSKNDLTNDLSVDRMKRNLFEKSVSSIFEKIKDFSIRETKDSGIIHLPEKIYHNLTVPFEKLQKEMYDTVREDLMIKIKRGGKVYMDESEESIKRLLRLLQITSNPKLLDDSYIAESAKELLLDQLLKRILHHGEKVIVWSIFASNIDAFCAKYRKLYKAVKITGSMTIEDRNRSVAAFKNGDAMVLFATPQSAKEGLTLTVANNAVFYDRGFNLDDYLQAQDRIHRISQEKDCNIYNLMIDGSIDLWIDKLLQAKQNAAFLAQGDINISEYAEEADYSFGNLVNEILQA